MITNRYHNALVTTELIKASDISTMRAKWAELKGTGEYEDMGKILLRGTGLHDQRHLQLSELYTQDPTTWDVLTSSDSVDS